MSDAAPPPTAQAAAEPISPGSKVTTTYGAGTVLQFRCGSGGRSARASPTVRRRRSDGFYEVRLSWGAKAILQPECVKRRMLHHMSVAELLQHGAKLKEKGNEIIKVRAGSAAAGDALGPAGRGTGALTE